MGGFSTPKPSFPKFGDFGTCKAGGFARIACSSENFNLLIKYSIFNRNSSGFHLGTPSQLSTWKIHPG